MATNPVNLVDAIATTTTRTARTRSGVIRFGVVNAAPSGGLVPVVVSVGGVAKPMPFVSTYWPVVGDTVALFNDRDVWLVLGQESDATTDGSLTVHNGLTVYGNLIVYSGSIFSPMGHLYLGNYNAEYGSGGSTFLILRNKALGNVENHVKAWDGVSPLMIQSYVDGVNTNRVYLTAAGQVYVGTSASGSMVDRPVPFAMACGATNNLGAVAPAGTITAAISFPLNRFTAPPVMATTAVHASSFVATNVYVLAATGISVKGYNPTTVNVPSLSIHWTATQMLSTGSAGLREIESPPPNVMFVCHTSGCENADIPIPMTVDPDVDHAFCGPCGEPVTDHYPI